MTRLLEAFYPLAQTRRNNLKKLLIALGLSSALLITPALAQTDQTAPATGAAPADQSKEMAKPMKHHHHKAKKHTMKKSKPMAKPAAAPADANAPKTQ
jgi:hypothetical protein